MNLHRSQTGFVPHLDIFVNLQRAINQIRNRLNNNKRVFCLFVDFKSAYNTIPHQGLFRKLRKSLPEKDIQLIKAIYSRLCIRLGNETMRSNTGVAQGSMISPALFDIYAEELLWDLCNHGWKFDGVLAYEDEHLIICESIEELQKAIQVVSNWCKRSKITLNPKKSGILEIIPRREKPSLNIGDTIPVVSSSRYLGLLLYSKLTGDQHVAHMNKKINFLLKKLAPLLSKVSFDYRCNLWKTLVKPLYKPVLALVVHNSATRINKLETNLKKSFKCFTGLARSTDNAVLSKLCSFDIAQMAGQLMEVVLWKWNQHCRGVSRQTWLTNP